MREFGVLVNTSTRGGRGRSAHYGDEAVAAVVAVEAAKTDPEYAGKLHHAVLIAWVRGAPVGTLGLQWAFKETYTGDETAAERRVSGKRVGEHRKSPRARLPRPLEAGVSAAQLGRSSYAYGSRGEGKAEVIGHAVAGLAPRVQLASARSDSTAFLNTGDPLLGFAKRVDSGKTFILTPAGEELWESLRLPTTKRNARTASREELDRAILSVRSMLAFADFAATDLTVAKLVPDQVALLRAKLGEQWWRLPAFNPPPKPNK
ncbi:hypothetical protein GHK86_00305 [Acidimicrobiaceae bacterium USS-CC1]|uniref:Uncharacterized protein n=1 Tax=Acidiferrimicrobium australe TaxID=2664430 RepID=A0ABW9QN54_9ACTN|nr:hypothetical protein [Acidiferrimicrobium australe]